MVFKSDFSISFFQHSYRSFSSTSHGKFYEGIYPWQLNGCPISKIDERKVYQLGFARKTVFHITHSAMAFFDEEAERKWIILGRQSPYFFVHNHPYKDFIRHFKIWTLFNTQIDNEQYYDLFKRVPFKVEMSTARFNGAEIREIVKEADQHICRPQPYSAVISNCYSASVLMLTKAIKILHETRNAKEEIASVAQLMQKATQDNFSIGVSNNRVVRKALEEIRNLTKRENKEEF